MWGARSERCGFSFATAIGPLRIRSLTGCGTLTSPTTTTTSSMHSGNREACIQLLSKENLNYIYTSAEANVPTSHHYSINVHSKFPVAKNGSNLHFRNSYFPAQPSHIYPRSSKPKIGRCSFSYFSPLPSIPCSDNTTIRPREIQSAPTIQNEQNPFLSAYNNQWYFNINSAYNPLMLNTLNTSSFKDTTNQTMTQNVTSGLKMNMPSGVSSSAVNDPLSNCSNVTQARHVTTLKINPQPFYLIEKYGYNPSSSVFTNVMPSGRHMTSVNLQLRPPSSEAQPPIEITTTPLNCAVNKNSDSNFNSQVRISINSTGATLTAMRTQQKSPNSSPTHHSVSMQRNVTHLSTVPSYTSNIDVTPKVDINEYIASENQGGVLQNNSQFQSLNSKAPMNLPKPWETATQPVLSYQIASMDNQNEKNVYDELAYTQALLLHQRSRLEVLQKVLNEERKILSKMKMEVNTMEEHLLQRKLNLTAISNMTDVQNLREENRRLRVECHCLSMEVDFFLKGQAPLGETDEDFYKNIFTGPLGPIPPVRNSENLNNQALSASSTFQDDKKEDKTEVQNIEEKDIWKCSKCTFANHPALNKCEMCEMTRTTDSGSNNETGPTYCSQYHGIVSAPQIDQRESSDPVTGRWPRQGIGHVQIRVTRNRTVNPSKGLELHLTHRYPRR